MSRIVPVLCAGCLIAIGVTAYSMLAADRDAVVDIPGAAPVVSQPTSAALHAARRTCDVNAIDVVVREQAERCRAGAPDAAAWHVLADALLEKVQARSHLRGIAVGEPAWTNLPPEVAVDIDAGLAAIARSRELGHDDADLDRIEAGLLGQRITGLATALQWNARIQAALARAAERAKDDPRVHVAIGVKKLLSPQMLGHDPVQALAHFEFAAKGLADDERPAVFAAMASYLQKKRQQAVAWLEKAVARNPNNVFARVVLGRVRRDEPDPFGRDVTASEAADAK